MVGTFDVPDLGAMAHCSLKDGRLELRVSGHFGHARLLLTPVSRELCAWEFSEATFPLRGTARVEREGGAVSILRLETLRTRGLSVVRRID